MQQSKQEVCIIRIMFPVESDEQAIDYKKKIGNIVNDVSDARMEFSITSMPSPPIKK